LKRELVKPFSAGKVLMKWRQKTRQKKKIERIDDEFLETKLFWMQTKLVESSLNNAH